MTSEERKLKCGHMHSIGMARCGVCDRCWECCTCKRDRSTGMKLARTMAVPRTITYRGKGIEAAQERYDRWWVGKMCRVHNHGEFKRVKEVRVFGNPSFVYGGATLVFDDGTERSIDTLSFVPRKYDVEVMDDVELH